MGKFRRVQNTAAQCQYIQSWNDCDHISPALLKMHWLCTIPRKTQNGFTNIPKHTQNSPKVHVYHRHSPDIDKWTIWNATCYRSVTTLVSNCKCSIFVHTTLYGINLVHIIHGTHIPIPSLQGIHQHRVIQRTDENSFYKFLEEWYCWDIILLVLTLIWDVFVLYWYIVIQISFSLFNVIIIISCIHFSLTSQFTHLHLIISTLSYIESLLIL